MALARVVAERVSIGEVLAPGASPLVAHAVSPDRVQDFKTLAPPVDERTKSTGKIGTYKHPHRVKEHPDRFKTNVAEYEIHEPEQNAYGDWAAICIGGQYYLFCDFDPVSTRAWQVKLHLPSGR